MLLIPSSKKKKLVKFTREKKMLKKIPNFLWLKKCQNLLKKKSLLPMKEGENCGHKSHSIYLTLKNLVI